MMLFTNTPDGPREPQEPPDNYLDIDTSWKRRWLGLVGYVLFFLIVAGALIWLFTRFTSSFRLAVLLVGVMVSYMLIMGYIATKRAGEDERGNLQ